jgi:hypothetical protein
MHFDALLDCYDAHMHVTANRKRRTTLTIPVETLAAAERIARLRKVNLSVIVSEVLDEGLRAQGAAALEGERRVQAWEARRQSHSRLTDEERLLLDGIILSEPVE